MRVTTHDGVDTADAAGHFQVHVHAVVADDDDDLRAFAAGLRHHLLHVLVLDAELPVGHHVTWVGNRGVGEGLANDGAGHAVDLADHIGLEHRVAKVVGLDVLRHKVDLACEVFFDDFLDAFHAQGEFPVAGHHVHAQQFAGVHHVLAIGPQAGARTLPGVTTIEQQSAGAAGLHAFDQRGQVCETANLAVTLGGFFEIKESQGMRFGGARADLGRLQQILSHQMRQIVLHGTDAQVDAGLAEINRLELRMAIGHVQERHIAELGNVVQTIGRCAGTRLGISAHAHAGHRASAHDLDKFAFGEIHICND